MTVFGAAAVVPWIVRDCPGAPFWSSLELDIDPGGNRLADLVDGTIGEGSLFEETFGVHAHGITLDAFIAPPGWESRSMVFHEPQAGVRVRAPHPRDLTVAKLLRAEERDWEFARFCLEHFRISHDDLFRGLLDVENARPQYGPQARLARSLLPARLHPP